MKAFTPDAGTLFYVTYNSYDRVVGDGLFGGAATVIKVRDGSYSRDIFRCVAQDSVLVIADPVTSEGYGLKPGSLMRFRKDQVRFDPVGPEVAAALGLLENPDDTKVESVAREALNRHLKG